MTCASNGKTSGITSPSASAQEAVVCKAHRVAGLDLKDTAYVECHGTGTSVGDPIEVKALSQAFAGRPKLWPLLIGGVSKFIFVVLAFPFNNLNARSNLISAIVRLPAE